jgi:uncharacterized OB-fold protein
MMGLERFGTVSFTSETKAADFVRYLEQGSQDHSMSEMRKIYFPPRMDCQACSFSEMEWIEIKASRGTRSIFHHHVWTTGFENEVPYTIAVIRLANGVQIFGRIGKKTPFSEIQVGMKLKVSAIKLSSGRVSFEFQPSDQ